MKFAVHTFYYIHNGFETMLRSLREANIRRIELYANAPHLCEMYPYTPAQRAALLDERAAQLRHYGIEVPCIFAPTNDSPVNIADENPEVRAFSLGFVLRLIEDAARLGSRGVLIDSGWGLTDHDRAAAWARSAQALRQLGAYAQEQGVELYLRAAGQNTNLVSDLASLRQMLAEVDSPALKACADLGLLAQNKQAEDYFRTFGERLGYVRLPNFGPAGELVDGKGLSRVRALQALAGTYRYDGAAAIEISWERLDAPHPASCALAHALPEVSE